MAKKIKFALEMKDGVKVRRDIEELRENFDLAKAIEHFTSGKLVEWLEDRYYDEIAEKIGNLDKEAPGFQRQLCEALGVEAPEEDEETLDVETIARTKEKETLLRQKTSDATIIANAARTAFDRADLADLWDEGAETIYLCGESFEIPLRVEGTKYIGILGTPKVTIKAQSRDELAGKGIVFENIELPEHLQELPTQSCHKCGANVREQANFCENCGAAMNDEASYVKENASLQNVCDACGCEIDESDTRCPVCAAQQSNTKDINQAVTKTECIQRGGAVDEKPIVNPVAEDVEKLLSQVQKIMSEDWWSLVFTPFSLTYREYSGTKSEMKDVVRSAGDEYESEAREILNGATEHILSKIEEVQEQYDDLFAKSGKAYYAPQPSANEVCAIITDGHNRILQGASGLGSTLVSKAKWETWSDGIFSPTDYSLDNSADLDDIAVRFFERLVSQYNQMGISEKVRSYFRSIKRGLERLQK